MTTKDTRSYPVERLRALMNRRGITSRRELAKRASISRNSANHFWDEGPTPTMMLETLDRIADVLGLRTWEMLGLGQTERRFVDLEDLSAWFGVPGETLISLVNEMRPRTRRVEARLMVDAADFLHLLVERSLDIKRGVTVQQFQWPSEEPPASPLRRASEEIRHPSLLWRQIQRRGQEDFQGGSIFFAKIDPLVGARNETSKSHFYWFPAGAALQTESRVNTERLVLLNDAEVELHIKFPNQSHAAHHMGKYTFVDFAGADAHRVVVKGSQDALMLATQYGPRSPTLRHDIDYRDFVPIHQAADALPPSTESSVQDLIRRYPIPHLRFSERVLVHFPTLKEHVERVDPMDIHGSGVGLRLYTQLPWQQLNKSSKGVIKLVGEVKFARVAATATRRLSTVKDYFFQFSPNSMLSTIGHSGTERAVLLQGENVSFEVETPYGKKVIPMKPYDIIDFSGANTHSVIVKGDTEAIFFVMSYNLEPPLSV